MGSSCDGLNGFDGELDEFKVYSGKVYSLENIVENMKFECDFTCMECNHKIQGICLSCRGNTRYLFDGKCICRKGYYDKFNKNEECFSKYIISFIFKILLIRNII